ncbi:MAG: Coenzyme F420 hydrogenase/dehydrogenase, beta subunit C-terminal domain [Bacteroidales bacterium]
MVNISKDRCIGCNACSQICPKNCISLCEDHEGFLYPNIDENLCVNCSLCEKVCKALDMSSFPFKVPITYAARCKDDNLRSESSSGGIFSLLAENIISRGGVVFGVRFDANWEAEHFYIERIEDIPLFQGSKYIQSRIGNSFVVAQEFLNVGREVLFSGTPCQIAALKLFLRKDYINLLTVDFVCHGVPSPKVWRLYKEELLYRLNDNTSRTSNLKPHIIDIKFRDKTTGWKSSSFSSTIKRSDNSITFFSQQHSQNRFMRGFLLDLYLRPSCHKCPSKNFKSGSDLTIADFWGIQTIHPELDDDKGVSLVMISTLKGETIYRYIYAYIESIRVSYESAVRGNASIIKSSKSHKNRSLFFKDIDHTPIVKLIDMYGTKSFRMRIVSITRWLGFYDYIVKLIRK